MGDAEKPDELTGTQWGELLSLAERDPYVREAVDKLRTGGWSLASAMHDAVVNLSTERRRLLESVVDIVKTSGYTVTGKAT